MNEESESNKFAPINRLSETIQQQRDSIWERPSGKKSNIELIFLIFKLISMIGIFVYVIFVVNYITLFYFVILLFLINFEIDNYLKSEKVENQLEEPLGEKNKYRSRLKSMNHFIYYTVLIICTSLLCIKIILLFVLLFTAQIDYWNFKFLKDFDIYLNKSYDSIDLIITYLPNSLLIFLLIIALFLNSKQKTMYALPKQNKLVLIEKINLIQTLIFVDLIIIPAFNFSCFGLIFIVCLMTKFIISLVVSNELSKINYYFNIFIKIFVFANFFLNYFICIPSIYDHIVNDFDISYVFLGIHIFKNVSDGYNVNKSPKNLVNLI